MKGYDTFGHDPDVGPFQSCLDCGATVHDRYTEVHSRWHATTAAPVEGPEMEAR